MIIMTDAPWRWHTAVETGEEKERGGASPSLWGLLFHSASFDALRALDPGPFQFQSPSRCMTAGTM